MSITCRRLVLLPVFACLQDTTNGMHFIRTHLPVGEYDTFIDEPSWVLARIKVGVQSNCMPRHATYHLFLQLPIEVYLMVGYDVWGVSILSLIRYCTGLETVTEVELPEPWPSEWSGRSMTGGSDFELRLGLNKSLSASDIEISARDS